MRGQDFFTGTRTPGHPNRATYRGGAHLKIKFTPKKYIFLHISSSHAKILGEKLFRTWEFPRSGSKAKDG